jgi:peptidoglycan/xylan/chitin deacetylase (PgdA/CDA1 family)
VKYATVPVFLKMFYPSLLWKMPEGQQKIYITFEITPKALEILDKYKAKATFFCVGENVLRHPDTYEAVLNAGHLTGNHSFNHLSGWRTDNSTYYENILLCSNYVLSKWFRPPYGRISPMQIQTLKKEFTIVMWSVLSYDFDPEIDIESCIHNVLDNTTDGAIIVFHDSQKAAEKMLPALEKTLDHFSKLGFSFERLDN